MLSTECTSYPKGGEVHRAGVCTPGPPRVSQRALEDRGAPSTHRPQGSTSNLTGDRWAHRCHKQLSVLVGAQLGSKPGMTAPLSLPRPPLGTAPRVLEGSLGAGSGWALRRLWLGPWEQPHLVEEPLGEGPEALGAHEAVLVVQLAAAADDPLGGGEAGLAALAHRGGQGTGHVAGEKKREGQDGAGPKTGRPGGCVPWTRPLLQKTQCFLG